MGEEQSRQPAQAPQAYQSFLTDNQHSLQTSAPSQSGQGQNMDVGQYPQHPFPQGAQPGLGYMDMRNLATALPHTQSQPFHFQHSGQVPTSQSNQYFYSQNQQLAGQAIHNFNQNVGPQYQQQFFQTQPRSQYSPSQGVPQVMQQPQSYQPSQMMGMSGHQFLHPSQSQFATPYGNRMASYQTQLRVTPVSGMQSYQAHPQLVRRTSSNSSLQASTLRGPPRKPKQSGHALWVGNLPPGTHILDLKDHFSTDATYDIESVFLISKSNCAFVNYKSESSCTAAMSRFHDSRFNGVRLVCRLRRGSSGPGTPHQPSATLPAPLASATEDASTIALAADSEDPQAENDVTLVEDEQTQPKVKDKYFVVKSLTAEDLERSVVSGVWATQAHNEQALNKAYQTAENVYLIFSANKSGEYFGYARMTSAIDDEAASKLEMPTRPENASPAPASDLPMTIPTPPTATATKGRVIDDSARGTIFWEADDASRTENESGNVSGDGYESAVSAGISPATTQTFGKPFKIEWVSSDKLPFYRTRGLRNPWNANREVKIARDGTEIEPSVGRRLTAMFHKPMIASSPVYNRQQGSMMTMQQQYQMQQGQMPNNPYGHSY